MRVNPSDRKACRACHAEIVWAQTPPGTRGKPPGTMPVDAEPSDRGNILLDHRNGKYYAGMLGKNQAAGARDSGQQLHLSHFATCPRADLFRKQNR